MTIAALPRACERDRFVVTTLQGAPLFLREQLLPEAA
jgi:hypothetical protein